MDARRLILPVMAAAAMSVTFLGALGASSASAAVPAPEVSPYLRAAIKADIEARGFQYGGDCKFDVMYLAPGKYCSMVQSVGANGADVTYGPYASGDITTAKFVRDGVYGWKNAATGIASPARVPALAASPGTKADSWVIEGINFQPGEEVAIFDGSGCGGDQRCPGDHVLATVKVGADGAFKTTVQFDPAAKPQAGQTKRLAQVTGGAFIQVAFHHDGAAPAPTPIDPAPAPVEPAPAEPTQPSQPAPANPSSPSTPVVTADDGDDSEMFLFGALGLGIAALAGFGIVTVARRR
jgi:hypothetical protein